MSDSNSSPVSKLPAELIKMISDFLYFFDLINFSFTNTSILKTTEERLRTLFIQRNLTPLPSMQFDSPWQLVFPLQPAIETPTIPRASIRNLSPLQTRFSVAMQKFKKEKLPCPDFTIFSGTITVYKNKILAILAKSEKDLGYFLQRIPIDILTKLTITEDTIKKLSIDKLEEVFSGLMEHEKDKIIGAIRPNDLTPENLLYILMYGTKSLPTLEEIAMLLSYGTSPETRMQFLCSGHPHVFISTVLNMLNATHHLVRVKNEFVRDEKKLDPFSCIFTPESMPQILPYRAHSLLVSCAGKGLKLDMLMRANFSTSFLPLCLRTKYPAYKGSNVGNDNFRCMTSAKLNRSQRELIEQFFETLPNLKIKVKDITATCTSVSSSSSSSTPENLTNDHTIILSIPIFLNVKQIVDLVDTGSFNYLLKYLGTFSDHEYILTTDSTYSLTEIKRIGQILDLERLTREYQKTTYPDAPGLRLLHQTCIGAQQEHCCRFNVMFKDYNEALIEDVQQAINALLTLKTCPPEIQQSLLELWESSSFDTELLWSRMPMDHHSSASSLSVTSSLSSSSSNSSSSTSSCSSSSLSVVTSTLPPRPSCLLISSSSSSSSSYSSSSNSSASSLNCSSASSQQPRLTTK